MNKTAIEMAIDDLNGYLNFKKTIDIKFVNALLSSYMPKEKEQMIDCVAYGNTFAAYKTNIDEIGETYYKHTFKKINYESV